VTLREGAVELESAAGQTGSRYELTSTSEAETKEIAGRLVLKHWDAVGKTGLVIGLDGPLGAGKTVFAKGVAEFLQISTPLTSPTYTYIEEYDYTRHQTTGKLYHLDMWKVDSVELFEKLELASVLKPGTVLVIEWWSQVAQYFSAQLKAATVPLVTTSVVENQSSNPYSRQLQVTEA
jgi:tRNA threonylcarbamoyl adenosine modification protein YjeE